MARSTLETTKSLMKATSGDEFAKTWRTYLDELMLAARAELDNG